MADPANIKFFWKKLQSPAGNGLTATSTESGDYDVNYLQDMLEHTKWKAKDTVIIPAASVWTEQTADAGFSGSFFGITYGNGQFVAVGGFEIQTSPDGITWTEQMVSTSGGFYDVTYGGGRFVAVGDLYELQTSTNGSTWNEILNHKSGGGGGGGSVSFYSVAYGLVNGNDLYVVVGQSGTILTSPDATTWTDLSPDGYSGAFRSVAFGNGQFVAVGDNGEIQTSSNGSTWAEQSPDGSYSGGFNGVAYGTVNGADLFVVVGSGGEIQTSPDGTNWTHRAPDGSYNNVFEDVTYYNGLFVAVGILGEIQTSPDGITWTKQDQYASYSGCFYGITSSNDLFVAVGTSGEIQASMALELNFDLVDPQYITFDLGEGNTGTADCLAIAGHNLATVGATVSLEGSDGTIGPWTHRNPDNYLSDFRGVTFGNGLFIAVGQSGEIQTSPDGTNWTKQSSGSSSGFGGVTYGNGLFVAVGGDMRTSTDGINWTAQTSANGFHSFENVGYGNGLFVAVGDNGEIQISSDGVNWTETESGTYSDYNFGVTYGDGLFLVASGGTMQLQTSPDGINWTAQTPAGSFSGFFWGVAYGNGVFVAVGNSGEIQTSPDGTNWTERTAANGYNSTFQGVTYGNGLFVAVGYSGEIQISPDGVNWTEQTPAGGYSNGFIDVVYGNDNFVVVGKAAEIQTYGQAWSTILNDFTPTDDRAFYKEFTSAEYRQWRLKLTGMSSAPEMTICIWGEKTELKRVPLKVDPDSQEARANVNVSETGVLLHNHENYVERKFEVDLTSVDDAMYQKVVEWFEGSRLDNFFLTYDTTNHPSKCWLMRPDAKFNNPFTTSSLRKVPLRLVGRKEE